MQLPQVVVVSSFVFTVGCAVALKPPPSSNGAQRVVAEYGSNVMRFEEFQVSSVATKSVTLSVAMLKGRAAVEARTVRFTVKKRGQPFKEIVCGAAPDSPQLTFGGLKVTRATYNVSCKAEDFTLEMSGDAERPIAGVVTYRGERFPVKTVFETAEKGQSAHIGFVVEDGAGWLASSDIQGATWVSPTIRPEAREAVVLANFAWASRRNVVMEGTSGITVLR